MKKLLIIILLLSSPLVWAQQKSVKGEAAKYDQILIGLKTLLAKVDYLEKRIDRLERVSGALTTPRSRDQIRRDNQVILEKWRLLDVNQSSHDVADLLGLPLEKLSYSTGEISEIWKYEFEGFISFRDDKVYAWRIPRNLRD